MKIFIAIQKEIAICVQFKKIHKTYLRNRTTGVRYKIN